MIYNPFQDGAQVVGEGYIGRVIETNRIMNVFENNNRSSGIVISGIPRIGKTSLVKNCFELASSSNKLENNRILIGQITVGTCGNFKEFLLKLSDTLNDIVDETDLIVEDGDKKLKKFFEKINVARRSPECDVIYELDRYLRKIFKELKKLEIKIVMLVDEFDSAKEVFIYKDSTLKVNFQKFRDYATDADFNITFLLTSRQNISTIEGRLPAGSTLKDVFSEIKLIGFSDMEQKVFFDTLKKYSGKIKENDIARIKWYAGRSPYLLSKFACAILNFDDKNLTIDEIFKMYQIDFNEYFNSLIGFMEREELYTKFIQLFIGPNYDTNASDIEKLINNGYVYNNKNDKTFIDFKTGGIFEYQTLSIYFIEYIRFESSRPSDTLVVWNDLISTEIDLRNVIKRILIEELGDNWTEKIKELASNKNKGYLFDVNRAEIFMNDSKRNFGDRFKEDILSVVGISSLGNIIKAFWSDRFRGVFNPPYRNFDELRPDLEDIRNARNPIAHGQGDLLSIDQKKNVSDICDKLRNVILKKLG